MNGALNPDYVDRVCLAFILPVPEERNRLVTVTDSELNDHTSADGQEQE
jgi:hypothetical protein